MIVGSALNTSRVCTATAGSRVSPDYKPDDSPNGVQRRVGRKGRCHIRFDAREPALSFFGFQYFSEHLAAVRERQREREREKRERERGRAEVTRAIHSRKLTGSGGAGLRAGGGVSAGRDREKTD